jgi:hypothetical protein
MRAVSHSCEHKFFEGSSRRSHECKRGTQECVRYAGHAGWLFDYFVRAFTFNKIACGAAYALCRSERVSISPAT